MNRQESMVSDLTSSGVGATPTMIQWMLKPFDELEPEWFYKVMVLRQRVFVVEQACAYLDCDGRDPKALHLLGRMANRSLGAYARLLPPGTTFSDASIGRVVVDPAVRRVGIGRALMGEAITHARATFGGPLRIGAQVHLERFYAEFGFARSGPQYDENGIAHVHMILPQ
jgi:ElaA protein